MKMEKKFQTREGWKALVSEGQEKTTNINIFLDGTIPCLGFYHPFGPLHDSDAYGSLLLLFRTLLLRLHDSFSFHRPLALISLSARLLSCAAQLPFPF